MADRRASPRVAATILATLAALVVVGAVAVEVIAEPSTPAEAEPVPVEAPDRGMLHCPATAGEEETATLWIAPAESAPTTVTVLRYDGGPPSREDPVALEPGDAHTVALEGEAAQQPAGVAWEGGPAVATWVRDGTAAPCEAATTPTWHVAGFDTTAQNASTLHLFNPFAIDAVVRVTFGTPAGRVALVLTDNVLVPARSAIRLNLGEFEPEQPDLAATVEVLTGRVVAQGELRMRPTEHQPGPSGRTLLPAVAAPETEWAWSGARVADGDASWIAVHNPGEDEAALELRVTDPLAGADELGREFLVPGGGTARIELSDVSESAEFGVVLTSVNEVPVTASLLAHAAREEGEDVAALLGRVPEDRWAVAGAATEGHRSRVAIVNPGGEPATVRLDAGAGSPVDWEAVEIAPNGRVAINLEEVGGRAAMPVRVHADRPVVADLRRSTPGDAVVLLTVAPVPSTAWEGTGSRPPVRRDQRLSTTPFIPPPAPDDG